MNLRKSRTLAAATLAAGALAASMLPATAATEYGDVPSYQQFRDSSTGSTARTTSGAPRRR
jgi:hypothetical protein